MRRLIAVFFGLVLIGVLAASAADLNVGGGTIQVFTVPFEPEQLNLEVEQSEHPSLQPVHRDASTEKAGDTSVDESSNDEEDISTVESNPVEESKEVQTDAMTDEPSEPIEPLEGQAPTQEQLSEEDVVTYDGDAQSVEPYSTKSEAIDDDTSSLSSADRD